MFVIKSFNFFNYFHSPVHKVKGMCINVGVKCRPAESGFEPGTSPTGVGFLNHSVTEPANGCFPQKTTLRVFVFLENMMHIW